VKLKHVYRLGMALWAGSGLLSFPGAAAPVQPQMAALTAQGLALAAELGCTHCHSDLPAPSSLRERTPDLGSAGLRYNPAYLFDYLQNPQKVRHHLGNARMPGLHLTPEEATALVRFLQTQQYLPSDTPPFPQELSSASPSPTPGRAQFDQLIQDGLICLTCHSLEGQGGSLGVELGEVSRRLQPDWVRRYLVQPALFGVAPATMPPQFYHLTNQPAHFEPIVPQAAEKIQIVTGYLFSLDPTARTDLEKRWTAAQAAYPTAQGEAGRQLFMALNCAACHRHPEIKPRPEPAAPPLAQAGDRLRPAWLTAYLRNPQAIRPFGFHPGEGSRMPDFRLTDQETAILSNFLVSQRGLEAPPSLVPRTNLTAFASRKARLLLETKLSCLGCHRLGSQGGRIAPDLAQAKDRLQPSYVASLLRDPQWGASHSIMPRPILPEGALDLLALFLTQAQETPFPSSYLSPLDHPLLPLREANEGSMADPGQRIYLSYCAACHGADGQGQGFNARYLPTPPTRHADASHMANRPDDTLYDGIAAGGMILNKHPFMPAWGRSLSQEQIQALVQHMRTLCHCGEPSWATQPPSPSSPSTPTQP